MILCCKTCGNCMKTDTIEKSCDYCGGNTDVLFTNEELEYINKYELDDMIYASREKYKINNEDYNEDLWKNREYKEKINKIASENVNIQSHMLTTGFNFEGYSIKMYKGVTSGQVVLGTGFLSEFTAEFADFFGVHSNKFADKLESAKNAAVQKLINKSASLGGNAIIGLDFDYITFANNMIGVVANGTSVIIEKD